jgi:hypothetical protein
MVNEDTSLDASTCHSKHFPDVKIPVIVSPSSTTSHVPSMSAFTLSSKECIIVSVAEVVEKRTTFMVGSAYAPSFFAIVQVWEVPLTAKIPAHSNDAVV